MMTTGKRLKFDFGGHPDWVLLQRVTRGSRLEIKVMALHEIKKCRIYLSGVRLRPTLDLSFALTGKIHEPSLVPSESATFELPGEPNGEDIVQVFDGSKNLINQKWSRIPKAS